MATAGLSFLLCLFYPLNTIVLNKQHVPPATDGRFVVPFDWPCPFRSVCHFPVDCRHFYYLPISFTSSHPYLSRVMSTHWWDKHACKGANRKRLRLKRASYKFPSNVVARVWKSVVVGKQTLHMCTSCNCRGNKINSIATVSKCFKGKLWGHVEDNFDFCALEWVWWHLGTTRS